MADYAPMAIYAPRGKKPGRVRPGSSKAKGTRPKKVKSSGSKSKKLTGYR